MNINNQGQPLQASLSSISPVAGRQGYGVLSNNDQNPQVHLAVQSLSQAAPGYQNFSQSYTESGPYAQYPQSHAAQVNPTASYAMRAAILAEAQHLPLDVCGSCQEISHLSGSPSANINGYGQSNSIQPQSSLASSLGLGFSHHPNYAACRTGNSISPQTAYSTAPQGGAGPQHPMPSQPQVASSPSSHGRQEQNSITGNKYHKQQEPQGYWDLPRYVRTT
ncbi:hypothetical protein K469DRAFT_704794 [Zopfia rhizophila CBS 207.26]|uniref:Uncharacterized protein n=1 Tax=Zopfia rhizophila CBS 207.26 TaxID=1314779 RepID=A0A6A6E7P5_9PEZI|nr:hypothetical protein K469DRAFT_704794 [Zopfia rhizophila CBS 207.26]